MRGLHPHTPVLFSSCWNTTLCSAGKGKHRAALSPSCCWSGSARRPRFPPLTPFPGISAVVLNLMLIYQPQAAQGGIFLARRSAARLKNQAAGRGATPLPARPAMPILFFALNRACRCNQGFCQGQGPFYPALTRRFQSARRICSICTAPGVSASCAGTCSAPCRS